MVSSMQGLYARLRSVDSDLLCPSQPGYGACVACGSTFERPAWNPWKRWSVP